MPLSLVVSPEHPEPRKIQQAARALDDGGVALYPTDTVYALGCALDARRAVDRIYRLKQMDPRQPLAMLCRDVREAATYAVVSDFAYRQMRRLAPGPYTFVLPATREVPRVLLDKRRSVGIRIPAHSICLALGEALGRPLLTSSAIPPGTGQAVADIDEGKAVWGNQLDLTIDGGTTPGKPSTVVSLVDDEIRILRAGLGADELS
jgi:tRNA threonylcarbamoyl adenosine modification protein (Sua5/YciO/YrdC/YwlC family)